MIYGGGVGEWLVKHPTIQAVGFTGSLKGGNALSHMAATRPQPIPVFAEMSSINPVFLLPEALAVRGEQIAAQLAGSVTLGCGQFCTNPGLVIGLRSPQFTSFLETFRASMNQQPAQTMLNAQGWTATAEVWVSCTNIGADSSGGQAAAGQAGAAASVQGRCQPAAQGRWLLQEEVFGPATIVIEVEDRAQLAAALQGLRGQLTATLIGEPGELLAYRWLAEMLQEKVGRILLMAIRPASRCAESDGTWRAVSGDVRFAWDLGRQPGHRPLPAPGAFRITRTRCCPRRCRTLIRWGDSAVGG